MPAPPGMGTGYGIGGDGLWKLPMAGAGAIGGPEAPIATIALGLPGMLPAIAPGPIPPGGATSAEPMRYLRGKARAVRQTGAGIRGGGGCGGVGWAVGVGGRGGGKPAYIPGWKGYPV